MQPRLYAARLRWWVSLVLALWVSACDGPGRVIVLGPLPTRPVKIDDEDAGPPLPEGAVPCRGDADCQDGIDCTEDICLPAHYCSSRLDNTRCSDGLVCNGVESCDPKLGCVTAPAPTCDDQDPCTIDRCDESIKDCAHDPRDFDRDGEADYHCPGGTDCDDFDPKRGMGAAEVCNDAVDNDCDDLIDEAACGSVPHDTCVDALDVSAGGTFEQPLLGALGDYATSCNDVTMSRDLVFTFQIDKPRDVKFVADGELVASDEVAAIALQTACGDSASELQCSLGFPGDLRVRALPAGRYYLVVASSFAARSLLLQASFNDPTPQVANKTCDTAIDVSKGGHFVSDFVDVGDDTTSMCGIEGQPDVFYKFHLNEEHDVEISAVGGEGGNVVVSVRKGCAGDAEMLPNCQNGQRVLTRLHQLAAGDYILVLEGPPTREIGYTLDVAIVDPTPPPQGDSCTAPIKITLGETQRVNLASLQDDIASSCQTAGPDAVLLVNVPVAQDLQLRVDGEGALAVASLQQACGQPLSERVCRMGTPVSTRLHDVPAGDYFIVVDSPTAPSVTVKIEGLPLTATTPVTGNDDCYSATEIPATGGLFSGDTSQLLQDYSASCGGGAASKDAAFRLTLTEQKHVIVNVDASFDSVLLRYDTPQIPGAMLCSDEMPARCNDDGGSGNTATLDDTLMPGTYYFIVDGYKDFNAGRYQLDVSVTDP